ncbi:MAG: LuxR C-terminal-related transcriptional regulator [Caldilineaceae bacterium]
MNEPLSEREIEILRLAADGYANGEIAARLSLSLNTIKWYSKRIYEKLGAESRTQAIKRAQSLGLLAGNGEQPLPAQPHYNLPNPLTAFIGRRAEVDAIKHLLKQHRLLTLTGPGGIGKTRLALQVAAEVSVLFPDGVCFVDLAAINETHLVINSIAYALGVAESLDTPLIALTQAFLRDRHLLLVLDNFEHLIWAAPVVAELLAATHHLTILLTSREILAIYGEQEYAVPPLQLPDLEWFAASHLATSDLLASEALQLFERCAQAVEPAFRLTAANAPAVASLCLRLDGLPLAIELAAAYIKLLSPQAMLTQLDSLWLEMKRTVRNIPARQQTLRNTIEWSYRSLTEEERRLFAQLAVFRGGCSWEAIGAICEIHSTGALLQALNGLVNKSLIWRRVDRNEQPRFGMLETIREYALLCLQDRDELEAVQQRHTYYYTQLAAHLESLTIKQQVVLQQLEDENDNFRVALRWSSTHDPEPGLNLIGDLGSCWRIRGRLTEGMTWAQQLLATGQQASAAVRARAYASAAVLSYVLGHRRQACQLADQGWLLAQQGENYPARAQTTFVRAAVLVAPSLTPAEYEEIVRLTQEAAQLFLTLKNPMNYARTFNLLGEVKRMQQSYAEAIPHYAESLRGLRAVEYQSGVAIVLANLGWATYHLGDYRAAFAHFTESIDLAYDLGFADGVAVALIGTAGVLTRLEEPHQAAQFLGAAEAIQAALGVGITAADEPDYQRTRIELQAQLGPADFDRCWLAGRALTVPAAAKLVHDFSSAQSLYA